MTFKKNSRRISRKIFENYATNSPKYLQNDIEFSPKLSSNFLKFLRKLYEISSEIYRKFIQKVVPRFFETTLSFFLKIFKYFQFFHKCYTGFSNFHFWKISPKFSKKYSKVSLYSKILQKSSKHSTFSNFLINFFANDDKSKLHYNVCKALSRKLEVSKISL